MRKKKGKRVILGFIIVIIIILNLYAVYFMLERNNDKKETLDMLEVIDNNVDIKEDEINSDINDNETIETMDLDLNNLKNINSDTVAYLKVESTNINYPVVKSNDNEYYLNHSFNKNKNQEGWIFLDYRNNINNLDNNTIIYGHNRLTGTMFGTLKNLLNKSYQESTNHYIYLTTENNNYVFEVFSTYITSNESYYLKTTFKNDNENLKFLNTLKSRSTYNFNIELNSDDKIITLSTCSGSNDRMVVHGKLIYNN